MQRSCPDGRRSLGIRLVLVGAVTRGAWARCRGLALSLRPPIAGAQGCRRRQKTRVGELTVQCRVIPRAPGEQDAWRQTTEASAVLCADGSQRANCPWMNQTGGVPRSATEDPHAQLHEIWRAVASRSGLDQDWVLTRGPLGAVVRVVTHPVCRRSVGSTARNGPSSPPGNCSGGGGFHQDLNDRPAAFP